MERKDNPRQDELTFEACAPEDYPVLLKFLDRAFSCKSKLWFANYMGHIFRPEKKYIAMNLVCRRKGAITGAIGIYPFKLRIGKAVLEAGGIGSVSVAPEERGKGIMSFMLREVNRRMRESGYDLSWLGGDRFRYRNYGWDQKGRTAVFRIKRRDVERYRADFEKTNLIPGSKVPLNELLTMYNRFFSGAVRNKALFNVHLSRKKYAWRAVKGSGGFAYCAFDRGNPENIVEIQGDPESVVSLLHAHFRKSGRHWCRIVYPCDERDPVFMLLHSICADFLMVHNNQIQIINVDSLWKKLVPELAEWYGDSKVLTSIGNPEDRRMVLERALGFFNNVPEFPKRLSKLSKIQPIPWWYSPVDQV